MTPERADTLGHTLNGLQHLRNTLAAQRVYTAPDPDAVLASAAGELHAAAGDWMPVPRVLHLLLEAERDLTAARICDEPVFETVTHVLKRIKRSLRELPLEEQHMLGIAPSAPPLPKRERRQPPTGTGQGSLKNPPRQLTDTNRQPDIETLERVINGLRNL